MPKGLKIVMYFFVGFISFVLFLYLTFPFASLKDRLLAGLEKGLKGKYEITVNSVSPGFLIAVNLKGVKLEKRDENGLLPVWQAERIKLSPYIFSVIFGSPKVKFDIRSGKGRVLGKVQMDKGSSIISVELDEVDLGKITYLASKYGINLQSKINGNINLEIDPKQIIRSNGTIKIEPNTIKFLASKIKAGALGEIEMPEAVIGAGKSLIDAELKRGAIRLNAFKLEAGDLNVDLTGSLYLSSDLANYRLNLRGTFDYSEKLGQALPILFMIEKQKNDKGLYPLTISGRLASPQIKIGDFTLPL